MCTLVEHCMEHGRFMDMDRNFNMRMDMNNVDWTRMRYEQWQNCPHKALAVFIAVFIYLCTQCAWSLYSFHSFCLFLKKTKDRCLTHSNRAFVCTIFFQLLWLISIKKVTNFVINLALVIIFSVVCVCAVGLRIFWEKWWSYLVIYWKWARCVWDCFSGKSKKWLVFLWEKRCRTILCIWLSHRWF